MTHQELTPHFLVKLQNWFSSVKPVFAAQNWFLLPKTHFLYAWNEFDKRINQFLFNVKIHLEKAENWFYSEKPVLGSKFILEAKPVFGLFLVFAKLQGYFAQIRLVGWRPCHFKTINWFSRKACSMKNAQNHAKQQINFWGCHLVHRCVQRTTYNAY